METDSIGQLQSQFGIEGYLRFSRGGGSMPQLCLEHPEGGRVELYLHGATVTSWKHPIFGEQLYLSSKAQFLPGKAIRGGVPLVFPQFSGDGPLPAHGVARNRAWTVVDSSMEPNGAVRVTLKLAASTETRAVWDQLFELTLSVTLGTGLSLDLAVTNTGEQAFIYQNALHSYFLISDVAEIVVSDLSGLRYRNNIAGQADGLEDRPAISPDAEIDRVYIDAPDQLFIEDRRLNRRLVLSKEGFADAVLWNPWIDKATTLADMGEGEFRRFVCIEAGNVVSPLSLQPGAAHHALQRLAVEKL